MKKLFISVLALAVLVSALFVPMTAMADANAITLGNVTLNVVHDITGEWAANGGAEGTGGGYDATQMHKMANGANNFAAQVGEAVDITAASYFAVRVKTGAAGIATSVVKIISPNMKGIYLNSGLLVGADGTITPVNPAGGVTDTHTFDTIPAGFDGWVLISLGGGICEGGGVALSNPNGRLNKGNGAADDGVDLKNWYRVEFKPTTTSDDCYVGDMAFVNVSATYGDLEFSYGMRLGRPTIPYTSDGYITKELTATVDYKNANFGSMDFSSYDAIAVRVKTGDAPVSGYNMIADSVYWADANDASGHGHKAGYLTPTLIIDLEGNVEEVTGAGGYDFAEIPADFDGYILFVLDTMILPGGASRASRSADGKTMNADDGSVVFDLTKFCYLQMVVQPSEGGSIKIGEIMPVAISDAETAPTPTPEATTPAPEGTTPPTAEPTTPPTSNPNTGDITIVLAAMTAVSGAAAVLFARKKND